MSEQELNNLISERIKYYMDLRNVTQNEFADALHVSQATISYWVSGVKTPKMSKIDAICEYLKIRRSDLMDHDKPAASSSEQALLLSYRKLDTIDQAKVQGYAEALLSTEKYKKPANEGLVS